MIHCAAVLSGLWAFLMIKIPQQGKEHQSVSFRRQRKRIQKKSHKSKPGGSISVGLLLCLFCTEKMPFWLHFAFTLLFTLGIAVLLCCSKKCAKLEISRIFTLRKTRRFTTMYVSAVRIWHISANFASEIKEKNTGTIRCFNVRAA